MKKKRRLYECVNNGCTKDNKKEEKREGKVKEKIKK